MFSRPDRSTRCSNIVPAPTSIHIGAYVTGGLKELYHRISRGETLQSSDTNIHTDGKGHFRPGHDGPVVLAHRYYVTEVLTTHGQSAVLMYAEDIFNQHQEVVIKVLHTSYFTIGAQEAECLRRLAVADPRAVSHTVKLLNTFVYGSHFCMVFESLCSHPVTEIFESPRLPRKQHEENVKKLTLQLLSVLGFLRQQNTIHADLKPDNILLKHRTDVNSVRVIDFGNSIQHVHKEVSLYYQDFDVQTLLYRAPEVMFGIPFGTEIDMWSLGCILAELYLGQPLFFGKSKRELLKSITSVLGPLPKEIFQRGKFSPELDEFMASVEQVDATQKLLEHLSGSRDYTFANFLAQLFRYDPDERMTPFDAAQHAFLAEELCLSFLLPPSSKKPPTSSIMLNSNTYKNSVKISSEVKRQNPSTYDLLNMGTKLKVPECNSHFKMKVAQVQPFKQEANSFPHRDLDPRATLSSKRQEHSLPRAGYERGENSYSFQNKHLKSDRKDEPSCSNRIDVKDHFRSRPYATIDRGRDGLLSHSSRYSRSRSPLDCQKTVGKGRPYNEEPVKVLYKETKSESPEIKYPKNGQALHNIPQSSIQIPVTVLSTVNAGPSNMAAKPFVHDKTGELLESSSQKSSRSSFSHKSYPAFGKESHERHLSHQSTSNYRTHPVSRNSHSSSREEAFRGESATSNAISSPQCNRNSTHKRWKKYPSNNEIQYLKSPGDSERKVHFSDVSFSPSSRSCDEASEVQILDVRKSSECLNLPTNSQSRRLSSEERRQEDYHEQNPRISSFRRLTDEEKNHNVMDSYETADNSINPSPQRKVKELHHQSLNSQRNEHRTSRFSVSPEKDYEKFSPKINSNASPLSHDLKPSPRSRSVEEDWKVPLMVKSRSKQDSQKMKRKKLALEQTETDYAVNLNLSSTVIVSETEDLSGEEARRLLMETTVPCEELQEKAGRKLADVCFIERRKESNMKRFHKMESENSVSHENKSYRKDYDCEKTTNQHQIEACQKGIRCNEGFQRQEQIQDHPEDRSIDRKVQDYVSFNQHSGAVRSNKILKFESRVDNRSYERHEVQRYMKKRRSVELAGETKMTNASPQSQNSYHFKDTDHQEGIDLHRIVSGSSSDSDEDHVLPSPKTSSRHNSHHESTQYSSQEEITGLIGLCEFSNNEKENIIGNNDRTKIPVSENRSSSEKKHRFKASPAFRKMKSDHKINMNTSSTSKIVSEKFKRKVESKQRGLLVDEIFRPSALQTENETVCQKGNTSIIYIPEGKGPSVEYGARNPTQDFSSSEDDVDCLQDHEDGESVKSSCSYKDKQSPHHVHWSRVVLSERRSSGENRTGSERKSSGDDSSIADSDGGESLHSGSEDKIFNISLSSNEEELQKDKPQARRQLQFPKKSKGCLTTTTPTKPDSQTHNRKSTASVYDFIPSASKKSGKLNLSVSGLSKKTKTTLSHMRKKTIVQRNSSTSKRRRFFKKRENDKVQKLLLASKKILIVSPNAKGTTKTQQKRKRDDTLISHEDDSDLVQRIPHDSESSDSGETVVSEFCVRKRQRKEESNMSSGSQKQISESFQNQFGRSTIRTESTSKIVSNVTSLKHQLGKSNQRSSKSLDKLKMHPLNNKQSLKHHISPGSIAKRRIEDLHLMNEKMTPKHFASTPRNTNNSLRLKPSDLDESIIFVPEPRETEKIVPSKNNKRCGKEARKSKIRMKPKKNAELEDEEEVLLIC